MNIQSILKYEKIIFIINVNNMNRMIEENYINLSKSYMIKN